MMSVYYPTQVALPHRNVALVDEKMHLLTSYKECLLKNHKESEEESKRLRDALKALHGIVF